MHDRDLPAEIVGTGIRWVREWAHLVCDGYIVTLAILAEIEAGVRDRS
jgi:hypothetical protein